MNYIQLGHLRIATSTRKAIANKLKHGITPQRILDDLREVNDTNISGDHLLNKKDISNIKIQYNIEGIQTHHNDLISVSSWVEEMDALE